MAFMRGKLRPARGGEHRTHYNPATANGVRASHVFHGTATQRLCLFCRKWFKTLHGGGKSDYCLRKPCVRKLEAEAKQSGTRPVDPDKAVSGWYEHIGSKPVYIESRKQLYRECVKNGVSARALMSGGVMKRPPGA